MLPDFIFSQNQILTRVETGKIWKSSWNSAWRSYQVTQLIFVFPSIHIPFSMRKGIKLVHKTVPGCTSISNSSPKLTISKDCNVQPPFRTCPIIVGGWWLKDHYPKGDNSILKIKKFNHDSFCQTDVYRGNGPCLHLHCQIFDTILKQEDKLSAKYFTSSLNIF